MERVTISLISHNMRTPNPQFRALNISDKFGDVLRTRNMNFDMQGYVQLSPRMARMYSKLDNTHFELPLSIGKQATGQMQVLTADANFGTTISTDEITVAEDTGGSNPSATYDSDGAWFNGLWHVSTATAVLSRPASGGASQAYTSQITGLTSGKRHILKQNKSRVQLCVSNGNVVKQYTTGYVNTTDLTIPADYEISGMEYNNGNIGIITRLASDGTLGNDQEAMFYTWNGSGTSANQAVSLGCDAGIAIFPYKSSFVVITRSGEGKYFNGAGFQTLFTFPFYFTTQVYSDIQANNALGNVFGFISGDNILINIGSELSIATRDGERYLKTFPAGIWCYDPSVGLYHRYSPSNSKMFITTVAHTDIDTSTNIFTTADTVPSTGNIARVLTDTGINGVTANYDYYVIKLSDTTFKLATTRELALAGASIDITSGGSGNNQFLMMEEIDYGTTYYSYPGAVSSAGDTANNYGIYTDIVSGARLYDTDGDTLDSLSIAVPWMENVGILETVRYISTSTEDATRSFNVGFKPLNDYSRIEIYSKTNEVLGVPVSTPNVHATWLGQDVLSTTRDVSLAEAYLGNGGSLVLEIVSGAGAGNLVTVKSIACENGTCSIELDNNVFGVQSGLVCDFIIDNYKKEYTITSDDNDDGYVDVSLDTNASKFAQFLIVPIGYDITIEHYDYKAIPHK